MSHETLVAMFCFGFLFFGAIALPKRVRWPVTATVTLLLLSLGSVISHAKDGYLAAAGIVLLECGPLIAMAMFGWAVRCKQAALIRYSLGSPSSRLDRAGRWAVGVWEYLVLLIFIFMVSMISFKELTPVLVLSVWGILATIIYSSRRPIVLKVHQVITHEFPKDKRGLLVVRVVSTISVLAAVRLLLDTEISVEHQLLVLCWLACIICFGHAWYYKNVALKNQRRQEVLVVVRAGRVAEELGYGAGVIGAGYVPLVLSFPWMLGFLWVSLVSFLVVSIRLPLHEYPYGNNRTLADGNGL